VYHGCSVGSVAHFTTFSLHPVKQMTTGEGGVLTTDDAEVARRVRSFRSHGIASDARDRATRGVWLYDMEVLGWNYRITDLQCALGLSQLVKLPAWLARRREIARRYDVAFAGRAEVELPTVLPDRTCAWHLYVIRLCLERLTVDRATIFAALRAENIGVNVHYVPVYRHSYYQRLGYPTTACPVAEESYERMITLPLWPGMTDEDVADVVRAVEKVCEAYRA
jgi:perosamine synthetase